MAEISPESCDALRNIPLPQPRKLTQRFRRCRQNGKHAPLAPHSIPDLAVKLGGLVKLIRESFSWLSAISGSGQSHICLS